MYILQEVESKIPDHSIQKLGLKLIGLIWEWRQGKIPDHSIQKLGLKHNIRFAKRHVHIHSRPFHSEIRIETWCY